MIKILILSGFAWQLVGSVFAIVSFASFDSLLKQLKAQSEESWVALGRPIGFFWVPPETLSTISSGFVRGELYRKWLLEQEPDKGSKAALAKLRLFNRYSKTCMIAGFVQWILAVVLVFAG